jgi:hypothetical protein
MDDAEEHSIQRPLRLEGRTKVSVKKEQTNESDRSQEETASLSEGDLQKTTPTSNEPTVEDDSTKEKERPISYSANLKNELSPSQKEIGGADTTLLADDNEGSNLGSTPTDNMFLVKELAPAIDDASSPKLPPPAVEAAVSDGGSKQDVAAPIELVDRKVFVDGINPSNSSKEKDVLEIKLTVHSQGQSLRLDTLGESSFGRILSFLTPFEGFAVGGALHGSTPSGAWHVPIPPVNCPKQLRPSLLVAARAFQSRPKAPRPEELPMIAPSMAESILGAGISLQIRAIGKKCSL